MKDRLLGYTRISCYDLSDSALTEISRRLARLSCDHVLGYSKALDALARHKLAGNDLWPGGKKAVIATAEALPFDDSKTVIEKAFDAPLVMEYGAVETGPIAYTIPEGGYRLCWWKYLLEQTGDGGILVTALYPRATPLFRYEIGDRLDGVTEATSGGSITEFKTLAGRSNAPVVLPSGRRLHSEVASHAFRAFSSIRQYQLECHRDHLCGLYVAPDALTELEQAKLLALCDGIDSEYGAVLRLRRCDFVDLGQAVSGKVPMVTYKDGLTP
ncbi:hypothetical protein MALG_02567 [Marinovum algicola DG 898]|nr:hypothetical protein MALG_02567 [Marinovum algicola DG 898]